MMWPSFLRRRHRRPCILMYHRIAEVMHDPWGLAVTPALFEAQIAHIARRFTPLPLHEFVQRVVAHDLSPDHVAITFDDGYPDNLEQARPVLLAHQVPATFFVLAGSIDSPAPFWWDELAALCLESRRDCDLKIELPGQTVHLCWSGAERADPKWRAAERPPGPREMAFLDLYLPLQRAAASVRGRVMDQLRVALGPLSIPGSRSMSRQELSRHLAGGLLQVGGHSVSHPALAHLPHEEANTEIQISLTDLGQRFGRKSYGFAYPYGDMSEEVAGMVRDAGFAFACSTRHAAVDSAHADIFALPRIAVANWTPEILDRIMAEA